MIPKIQTRTHRGSLPHERGNCLPAVIASILEMEVEDVFQVQEYYDQDDYRALLLLWLSEKGYRLFMDGKYIVFDKTELTPEEEETKLALKDDYYLVIGRSPRSPLVNHVVIYQNGIMVHDPHPDGGGVLTHDYYQIIEKI